MTHISRLGNHTIPRQMSLFDTICMARARTTAEDNTHVPANSCAAVAGDPCDHHSTHTHHNLYKLYTNLM